MEDIYAAYTRSERYLLILLSIDRLAILIALFGAYSIITLACRRRHKEIAIRKVNGATVRRSCSSSCRDISSSPSWPVWSLSQCAGDATLAGTVQPAGLHGVVALCRPLPADGAAGACKCAPSGREGCTSEPGCCSEIGINNRQI